MSEEIKFSKGRCLQELLLARKRILDDLRRVQDLDAEPAHAEKLKARRRLKEQLKSVNTAIKAAGGKIQGAAAIAC